MQDHIAKIYNNPAVAGEALLLAPFLMFGADIFNGGFGKRIQHTVAGAGTDNKIIGKRDDFFQVHQDDIFTLFVFQGVYDFTSKF